MKLTDYEYAIQMAEIARRAAGNTPEGAEHVARLEKIAARLDDARVERVPLVYPHDDWCERISVDVGVGSMDSPCECKVRHLERRLADAYNALGRHRCYNAQGGDCSVCGAAIDHE